SPVFDEAHRVNDAFDVPLDPPEVAGIARSVERYRRRWIDQGRFWGPGKSSYDHSSEAQAKRGKKSGQARRKRTEGRDAGIVQAWLSGTSIHALSRLHRLSRPGIRKILKRDCPLFSRGEPNLTQVSRGK
ncbi:MAG: hypothetical protein OXK20_03420, partial [Deltaproteobacteria bacterium]|nr:hypothetical protein [Deltaproteobacteria bacterium]